MKYFKLIDTTNYGDILRIIGRHGFEYIYGVDDWVRTSKLLQYLWEQSEKYGFYEEISEEKAFREIKVRGAYFAHMFNLAREIAEIGHQGQKDKGGQPYIRHPLRVAEGFRETEYKIVALLHDICEDSDITLRDLEEMGFSKRIIRSLAALTQRQDEEYNDYLGRVKQNHTARKIKIADLKHNLEISRIANPQAEDYRRLKRYKGAIKYLSEA